MVALIVKKKKNTFMSQLFSFCRKTQRTKTYPGWLPHAEKPEKKIVSVKERVLFCNKCRRHGPFHNIGATVRAAAVNYTKHDNNNTITTITQRRKQRERKKKKTFLQT